MRLSLGLKMREKILRQLPGFVDLPGIQNGILPGKPENSLEIHRNNREGICRSSLTQYSTQAFLAEWTFPFCAGKAIGELNNPLANVKAAKTTPCSFYGTTLSSSGSQHPRFTLCWSPGRTANSSLEREMQIPLLFSKEPFNCLFFMLRFPPAVPLADMTKCQLVSYLNIGPIWNNTSWLWEHIHLLLLHELCPKERT